MATGGLRRWWFGPLSSDHGLETYLGSGSVTVEAVREAVVEAREALNGWSATTAHGPYSRPEVSVGAHQRRREVFDELSDVGESSLNEMTISLSNSEPLLTVALSISSRGCTLSGDPIEDGAQQAFAKARAAVVGVLEREMERRVPSYRWKQLAGVAAALGLSAVWLWAMLSAGPAVSVWVLSLTAISAPIWLALSSAFRSAREAKESRASWIVTVDSTPREELRAQRFNRRENVKQRVWTALIAAPAGAVIGAIVTALLRG